MTAIKALCKQTGTIPKQWDEIDGPDSGHGVDHYFMHAVTEEVWYANEDQGDFSVYFCSEDEE